MRPQLQLDACINLEDCGITVKDAVLDPEQKLMQNQSGSSEEEERRNFLGRVFRLFADKLFQPKPESFSNAWLRQSLNGQEYMWLDNMEATKLLFPNDLSFDDYKESTLSLIAPHFYTYTLAINRKKLDLAVRSYFSLYQEGKLSLCDTLNGILANYRDSMQHYHCDKCYLVAFRPDASKGWVYRILPYEKKYTDCVKNIQTV